MPEIIVAKGRIVASDTVLPRKGLLELKSKMRFGLCGNL